MLKGVYPFDDGKWWRKDFKPIQEYGDYNGFLVSSASDAINGHILYVDWGILAYIGK